MPESRLGVGIIGVSPARGWAAEAHIPALRALPNYEIHALSALLHRDGGDFAAARAHCSRALAHRVDDLRDPALADQLGGLLEVLADGGLIVGIHGSSHPIFGLLTPQEYSVTKE